MSPQTHAFVFSVTGAPEVSRVGSNDAPRVQHTGVLLCFATIAACRVPYDASTGAPKIFELKRACSLLLKPPNSSTLSPKCSLCRKCLRSMRLRHCAPRCSSRRSCSTLLSSTCAVVLRCARCLASSCCFAFVCLCFAFLLCLFCFVLFCLLCCVELCVGVLSARARSPHLHTPRALDSAASDCGSFSACCSASARSSL